MKLFHRTQLVLIVLILGTVFTFGIAVYVWQARETGAAPGTAVGSENDESLVDKLKSLGYLTWVPSGDNLEHIGVVLHTTEKTCPGINIYNSRNRAAAYLMDNSGNLIHTWSAKINPEDTWHHVEPARNGDLLAVIKHEMLVMLDWHSNVKWTRKMRFHHDAAVADNGDIYTLVSEKDTVPFEGADIPIINDYIRIFTYEGELKRSVSLAEIFTDNRYFVRQIRYRKIALEEDDTFFDIFHTNSIEIIDRAVPGICENDALLLSFRTLDLIAVIDIETEEILWEWGPGRVSRQHHPSLLDTHNILVFDNGEKQRRSRVVEVDPVSKEIVWEYRANPPEDFYSPTRGACQRLPNGNTLITDSDSGRVFEVTRDHEIVWDFYNPEIKETAKVRATIYRMMRLPVTYSSERL